MTKCLTKTVLLEFLGFERIEGAMEIQGKR